MKKLFAALVLAGLTTGASAQVDWSTGTITEYLTINDLFTAAGLQVANNDEIRDIENIVYDNGFLYINIEVNSDDSALNFDDLVLKHDISGGTTTLLGNLDDNDSDDDDFRDTGGFVVANNTLTVLDFATGGAGSGASETALITMDTTTGNGSAVVISADLEGAADHQQLSGDELLVVRGPFGGDNSLRTVNQSTGTVSSPLATFSDEPNDLAVDSNGDAFVYIDNTNEIIKVTDPAGAATTSNGLPSSWSALTSLQIEQIESGPNDELIGWFDGDPGFGGFNGLRIDDGSTSFDYAIGDFETALGASAGTWKPENDSGALTIEPVDSNNVNFYFATESPADMSSPIGIVRVSFSSGTSVQDWSLYQ